MIRYDFQKVMEESHEKKDNELHLKARTWRLRKFQSMQDEKITSGDSPGDKPARL